MVYRKCHAGKSIQISIHVFTEMYNKEIKPEFIQVHGTFIPHNNEVKLLGITIDDKLKFDRKVDLLCKNAAR